MPGLDDLTQVERLAWEALEGAPIDRALEAMCDAIGGVTGSSGLVDAFTGLGLAPSFAFVDPDLADLLIKKFDTPEVNPFLAALPSIPPRTFVHASAILDMERLKRTDFYNDWWVPTGVNDHGGGIMVPAPDGRLVWTVIGCMGERDWLDSSELHFAYTACGTIGQTLRAAAAHAHAHAGGVLAGHEPDPSWLLDRHGVLRLANGAAQRMLDDGRGPLRRRSGGLVAAEACLNPRLQALAAAALRGGIAGGSLVLRWGKTFARLIVEPGPRYRDDRSVMLTLHAARPARWGVEELRLAFGLTRREAEVAIALGSGARPLEIAEILGLTPGSVRLYLKRVYAKTGAKGQGALVVMLLTGRAGDSAGARS